jgi:hypothetical protein
MVTSPSIAFGKQEQVVTEYSEEPVVAWWRNAYDTLKREKQEVLERQRRSQNLYEGGAPWWKHRPKWKVGTRFNFCFYVPQKWTQVLCDSQSTISYSAFQQRGQFLADIATAALHKASTNGQWDRIKRQAVLNSRVQGKSFLRLVPEFDTPNGRPTAKLSLVTGEQLFVDENARTIDDAEIIIYEFPLSANMIFSRWPKAKERLLSKRHADQSTSLRDRKSDVLSPPTTMSLPNGNTVQNPPYAAGANPPDNAGSSGGYMVRECWAFPKKTTNVKSVRFTASGEPATRPKKYVDKNGKEDDMLRVLTEGGILYEFPQAYTDILNELDPIGGLKVLYSTEAREVIKDDKPYLLYPHGRVTVIVDGDIKVEDRRNPLGYTPFIEIEAYPDVKFWGFSDNDIIGDAYEYYMRLLCSLLDAANLTSNPIWRLPLQSEMSDEDITNAPGAIQREDLVSLRYGKREPGPDMPQYVMQLLAKVEELIMKMSNLNEIATGQAKFKGQQSAETVSMYQDTAAVSFRDALASIQRADEKLGYQFLELVSRFYTTPDLVSIKNAAGVDESIPFLGTYLVEPLRVDAKPGSSMPNSPSARLNMMLNMLQSGAPMVDLPEVWRLMEQVGYIDSASGLERRIEKEMFDPKQAWKVPGRPQPQAPKKQAKKANGRRSNRGKG